MRPTLLTSLILATPPATVQKMIGAISILMSFMKTSPSGLSATPNPGQTTPTSTPRIIPISTCA